MTTNRHAFGQPGHCAMRGSCGTNGWFGQPLPCPYDGPAVEPEDEDFRADLVATCGPQYASGPVCCTAEQLVTLKSSLQQAEGLISSCPACRNNFRSFYCSFTCSSNQGTFLSVSSTQKTKQGKTAVKSVDFLVGEEFGTGFYDSCKDIKFSAINGNAMDLLGGGAKNYSAFLQYMGQERPGTGSPFQINYPSTLSPEFTPFNPSARACHDADLGSRCTCIDCPSVCATLPEVPPPGSGPTCNVGAISCLSFILILGYSLAVFGFSVGYLWQVIRRRKDRKYERVALSAETGSNTAGSPLSNHRVLIGSSSLAHYIDGEDSLGTQSESRQLLGRGASLLDPLETGQPRQYRLNTILRWFFYRLGLVCASYPWLTFFVVFSLMGILNLGWKRFTIETDPVRLWVSPTSESKLQKEFFDQHFGPFYRPQQIFVTAASAAATSPSSPNYPSVTVSEQDAVLTWDRVQWWMRIEEGIRSLRSHPNGYGLHDVCYKPAGPRGACVVQSIGAYFGNDPDDWDEDTWADQLVDCAAKPGECLPDFGQPLQPQYILGGVPESAGDTADRWLQSRAMVVTFVVSDSLDPVERAKAEEWERSLRQYLTDLRESAPLAAGAEIEFSTGVSLEEEINKSTNTDAKIVVLSYLVMFFYIALTLGHSSAVSDEESLISSLHTWAVNLPRLFKKRTPESSSLSADTPYTEPQWLPRLPRRMFVGSKFTLGLFGITLVILSVSASVGLFSFLGVKVTLIIAEVIPFLVLAVGVDNVFILVHELDRQNALHGPNAAGAPTNPLSPTVNQHSSESSMESTAGESAPQHFPPEERVARTLAKMGPSILLSSITETLAFALGALVPMPAVRNFALYAAGSVFLDAVLQVTVFISALAIDLRRVESHRVDCFPCLRLPPRIALLEPSTNGGISSIGRFIRRKYAPFLLQKPVKGAVIAAFGGAFIASVISMQHIQLGLDQRLALPADSYLIPYFNAVDNYFDVGPPVYFVSHDVSATTRDGQQALCGRFTTCNDFSIANVLEAERKRPESSFIAEPAAGWIDDFLHWLDPAMEKCCRVRKADPSKFCNPRDNERLCRPCYEDATPPWNITMNGLPEGPEFMRYLKQWLESPTDDECPIGGKASYGSAVSISADGLEVSASHFRTFHTPLKTQDDFINAFEAAHRIADDLSRRTGTSVFPYSLFYVFFDQYAHIISITQEILGLGLAAVLVVTSCFLGSWRTGSIVTGVVASTVVNVMGIMGIWRISLNAISLVNLVISLGIAVEFCSHVARAFMGAGAGLPIDHPSGQKERDERMWTALTDVGPSVLSGITFTKLIGISVLALTRSKLLEIYYFRMWLTLIISGALHGLVLLPVILSIAGGPGYAIEDADEEWMTTAIRRHDYEYRPFLAESDGEDSD